MVSKYTEKVHMEPKLQLVIEQKAVISHFCWAFANALLQNLKKIIAEDHFFLEGNLKAEEYEKSGNYGSEITQLGNMIINSLEEQVLPSKSLLGSCTPSSIKNYIEDCQKFLDIFIEKTPQEIQSEGFGDGSRPEPDNSDGEVLLPWE